ncbi:hypothetical protein CT694_33670 (plasmid) [Bacillus wiedmannii bv. thuringiensis]|nr:hypothetical protein CT694_33670 [Bacillus wiedmannii bv. thuringiensis]
MDYLVLTLLFFVIYALLFVICMVVIHFIFTIIEETTRVDIPGFGFLIGIFAGISSSLIMILIIRNMPI